MIVSALMIVSSIFGQTFEEKKLDGSEFEKVNAKIGADFAMQFQGINHEADSTLIELGKGLNLPTANFIIIGDLAPGVKVNLETYLSSRHHVEAWVKGGYLQFDKLPFIKSDMVDDVMDYLTLKVGVMEINYGDAHFRRSDNGRVINNSFVGNYVMDAFTTAPSLEVLFRHKGIIAMGAVSTGSLKPALAGYSGSSGYTAYNAVDELAFYGKVGYDKQLNDDFRIRGTVSAYTCANHHFGSLYYGDRTGSRYYMVMNLATNSSDDVDPAIGHTSGRWGPGFTDENTAMMVNVFAKYKGLEIFGTLENTTGTSAFGGAEFTYTQYAAEGLYRFGKDENFFVGLRYNSVTNDADLSVDRMQYAAGWKMTKNIVLKLEYVDQSYTDFTNYGDDAGFNGIMAEATISF